jgi:hypothetical protein
LRQPEARRRWLTLAANRGDCAAMSLLHGAAIDARDSAGRSHWNEMLRRNACTWGKTYGTESTPNRPAGDMPLWDDR